MVLTGNFPLPEVSLTFESAVLNQGPYHRLIPKYKVEPLAHPVIIKCGNSNVVIMENSKRISCYFGEFKWRLVSEMKEDLNERYLWGGC